MSALDYGKPPRPDEPEPEERSHGAQEPQEPQGSTQEPMPPMSQGGAARRPDSAYTSPEQAKRARGSDELDAASRANRPAMSAEPPPDFERRFAALIKSRVDMLTTPLVDDRGKVLREPVTEEEALAQTMAYLPNFVQTEYGANSLREYFAGFKPPFEFVGNRGVVPSQETQELQLRAKLGREEANPLYLLARDFVIDPVGNFGKSFFQTNVDVGLGLGKMAGVVDPKTKFDVETFAHGLAGTTRAQLDAIAAEKPGAAQAAGGAGHFVGMAAAMGTGGVGKVLGIPGKAGEGIGKALFAKVGMEAAGKTIGHSAGVFAAYEGIVAEPGKRMEGVLHGAESGAMMGAAQRVVGIALRKLFHTPIKALGKDEKATMESLRDWAAKNKITPESGEPAPAYDKRVIDAYIGAGLPGAPMLPVQKIIGAALKGGADAIGFSALDQQFRKDFLDAAWKGDKKAWERALVTFSGNFLGAAALHMPLKSIVPWQRRQSTGKPEVDKGVPIAEAEFAPEGGKSGDLIAVTGPAALPAPVETRAERVTREQNDKLAEQYLGDWTRTLDGYGKTVEEHYLEVAGVSADNVIALGWKPEATFVPEAGPVTVSVGGNQVRQLLASRLIPENSELGRQLREQPDGGEFTIPAKEAKKFADYYRRRGERLRGELGQSAIQSLDAFVETLTGEKQVTPAARPPFDLSEGVRDRLEGPEGSPAPRTEPIGVPVTGEASPVAEAREGVQDAPVKLVLPGTEHSVTIKGATARPSESLREATGLPKEAPTAEVLEAIEKLSLADALKGKANLPGDEITVGTRATASKGEEPGTLRRVSMGEVQESPFVPEPKWEKAKDVPARGHDPIDQEQQTVVDALREAAVKRDDIPPLDRSLLNSSIDVLDKVSADKDQSVAETLQAMPEILKDIEAGKPEAVKVLAEALTTKTPERAKADAKKAADIKKKAAKIATENVAGHVRFSGPDRQRATITPKSGRYELTRYSAAGGRRVSDYYSLSDAVEAALKMGFRRIAGGQGRPVSMLTRMKQLGGISPESWERFIGEKRGEFKIPFLVRKGGMRWDQMAITLAEEGYYPMEYAETTFVNILGDQNANNVYAVDMGGEKRLPTAKDEERLTRIPATEPEAERAERLEREAEAEAERAAIQAVEAEAEAEALDMRREREGRAGERGHIDLSPAEGSPAAKAIDEANRAIDAIKSGVATGGSIARKAIDFFSRSQIQRVEDMGMRKEAEMGRDMTTATKRFASRHDAFGLMDLRRADRKDLDSMEGLVRDEHGGYATVFSRLRDEAIARHFGEVDRSTLTEAQRKIVAAHERVTYEGGKIAEELGIEQTGSDGKNPRPFKADPDRRVLTRQPTPEFQQALIRRSGPMYDAWAKYLTDSFGWTRKEVDQHYSEGRNLTSLDATEVRRDIPYVPIFLDVQGKPQRLFEDNPLAHAEAMAFRNAQVMGARSVMPRFEPKKEGDPTYANDPLLEPLPPTAQAMVDKALKEHGPEAAEAVALMVRAAHGMQLTRERPIFTPGEKGYHLVRVLDRLLGVHKAGALTMSFAQNLAEPVTNIAHFGASAIGSSYKDTLGAFTSGRFNELHEQLVREGYIADTKANNPWTGDNLVESVEKSLEKIGEIVATPLRLSQDFNEVVNAGAARERLAAMKAGNGSRADANALSLLGFDRPTIASMLKGQGTEAQYERYQRNIVGKLAGGRSLRSAEKSDAGHSRAFNSLVWFTNFFQARTAAMDQLYKDMKNAPPEQKAAQLGQLLKFAALTTAGGVAGNLLRQYLLGGNDGAADYLRELKGEDAGDFAGNMLGALSSGLLGGVGQPVVEAFDAIGEPGDSKNRIGAALQRMIGPLDATRQLADYMASAFFDVEKPGYEGKDLLGKTAKYLRDSMPAAKAVHEGLFGMAALAISDKNIELDNAQDSRNRWVREHRPGDLDSKRPDEETREWRQSMRAVMDKVAAGKRWTDDELVAAVVDAESARMRDFMERDAALREQGGRSHLSAYEAYKQARQSVAASLRDRKMLPKPGDYPTAQVESLMRHLGEKNVQTLRDFDEVLELLAKRVQNANLRGAANERAGR